MARLQDYTINGLRPCGCYIGPLRSPTYLPMVGSAFHSTIVSTSYSTKLTQTFSNPSEGAIEKCKYQFPLYDGVSVAAFTCTIGDRKLHGIVREKVEAKAIFDKAVSQGQTAGLLEQSDEAADVFSTSLGNVPAGSLIVVEITYIGELKHGAEADGIRFTIPTAIAPRYGAAPSVKVMDEVHAVEKKGVSITVDVNMPKESSIKSIQSPSHPLAVSMGVLSTATEDDMALNKASATLSQGDTTLGCNFVLVVNVKDSGNPFAVLETHSKIPHQRAIMASLVPNFSLPPARPEIIFIADRSGSMGGNIPMLQEAMRVFLKSLPAGVKFNIMSFGSHNSTLWSQSKAYAKDTLSQALKHVETFDADFGGTETLSALQAAVKQRYTDLPLDMILLTDGDIWQQETAFKWVSDEVDKTEGGIRLFPLGIGSSVSHALIEGLARSGNGFAQAVQDGERMDKRVVRMLRGALSPHISDYKLEIKYQSEDDEFELVDKVNDDSLAKSMTKTTLGSGMEKAKKVISLFNAKEDPEKEPVQAGANEPPPDVPAPKILQAPYRIPSLFAFSRTTVYLLQSPETIQKNPQAVILRGTSAAGPLHLEIPIEALPRPGQTIHQLAARKLTQDLEEGRGWIHSARTADGKTFEAAYPSRFPDLVQREAVRLGTTFGTANRWCSFVAVAANSKTDATATAEKEKEKEARAAAPPSYDYDPTIEAEMIDYSDEDPCGAIPEGTSASIGKPTPGGFAGIMRQADRAPPGYSFAGGGISRTGGLGNATSHTRRVSPLSAEAAPPPPAAAGGLFGSSSGASRGGFFSASGGGFFGASGGGFGGGLFGAAPGAARSSVSGQQPRKHLASKAARPSAPAPAPQKSKGLFGGSGSARRAEMGKKTSFVSAGVDEAMADADEEDEEAMADEYPEEEATEDEKMEDAMASPTTDAERVHALIALQDFDGFWAVDDKLVRALGVQVKKETDRDAAWCTVLVLWFLREKMRAEEEVWEMVAEKAEAWLEGQGVGASRRAEIETEAKAIFVD